MRITESKRITDFFACNVFNDATMKKYLDEESYFELKEVIDEGKALNKTLANKVASAMMEWATNNGCTHFTHWFQPLTGTTAEKHDSFISIDKLGKVFLEFTGSNLRKGEADASSFPSGGIRATFEARGYTAWDCSSPAFIKKSKNGAGILYVPTAFCSYNGEALDKKTPLLKSMNELSNQAVAVLRLLGEDAKKVIVNVGGEQEYFLIDKKDFNNRYDLKFTGRTLFGSMPPKGQEKNDQYYASIRERVSDFMAEVNEELWKLGVLAKTQHNEVAPAQHELAPIFSTANIATDQNQIIMETLKKVADDFGLACLLHEKPFDGINGSGKHCNWSLSTDKGDNLLKPGKDPAHNLRFLLFFIAVISAVDDYADLLRLSAASLGNEFRLGGNEAPPSIVAIYIGNDLELMFRDILQGKQVGELNSETIFTGVNYLAELSKDTSDRNRTSPFAFTGNKFEFRMVGSSATLSTPTVIINTIVAEHLGQIATELQKLLSENNDINDCVMQIVKQRYIKHSRVIFNGNNYGKEWIKEAKKRGLVNIDNSVDAYESYIKPKNVELFRKHNVLSLKEIQSRYATYLDNYIKSANIEAETLLLMARKQILPVVMMWQANLARDIASIKLISDEACLTHHNLFTTVSALVKALEERIEKLRFAKIVATQSSDIKKQGFLFRDQVLVAMAKLREVIDKIEVIVPKELWPVPTYADMLFYQ